MKESKNPKLAVWKFASCDGCQLSILNFEEELLLLENFVTIAYFPEASSKIIKGPYDISLVEGSITTEEDAARIHAVRKSSKLLVTIGACATAGGIQALRNFAVAGDFARAVYPEPQTIRSLAKATPIADHVRVDYELHGCPVDKDQLLETIGAFLKGRSPAIRNYSVCEECKLRENVCVTVAHGIACLGPVTHAGCGAICPAFHRGCYGCFGPKEGPNMQSLSQIIVQTGASAEDLVRMYRNYNACAEAFRKEGDAHDRRSNES